MSLTQRLDRLRESLRRGGGHPGGRDPNIQGLLEQFHSMRAALHLVPRGDVERRRLHAVTYRDPDDCLAAVRTFREEGFTVHDVHTPFPVHGMPEAVGLPPSRLGIATFAGGALGLLGAVLLQTWVHAVAWPLDIGGKSYVSGPAQVPVAFEMTVLLAAFATVGGLLAVSRLWPRLHPERVEQQPAPEVTDDRFIVLVLEGDGSFDPVRFRSTCSATGGDCPSRPWRIV